MSFFKLFKPKGSEPTLVDKVFLNSSERDAAVQNMLKAKDATIFLVWTDVSLQYFKGQLANSVQKVNDIIPSRIEGKEIIFLEHHYSRKKEMDFIKSVKLDKVIFINSLDDHLFKLFNSERIKTVMEKMGHKENESLEHPSITKSIGKAQDKIFEQGLPEDCEAHLREWYDSMPN